MSSKKYDDHIQNQSNNDYHQISKQDDENNSQIQSQQNKSQSQKQNSIGHYILNKTLGEGTFGKVKLAMHILTGEKVAIKILEKERIIDASDVERVSREIHILKQVRHSNIIQLYEIIETSKQLFLVMEYASGGELFDYIVANKKIKEKEACKVFYQILNGIEYIHKLNIVHRDLKPENLLLSQNKTWIKIVDFGLSNTYKNNEKLKTACGSPCYAAPEMISGKRYSGLQVDIWSCGIILYALICGYLPFEDPKTSVLYKKILSGEYAVPKFLSTEAKDLLKNILNTDPEQRYTIPQIRKHPWFELSPQLSIPEGIIVGQNKIPVDKEVLKKCELFGFNKDYVRKCIENNKHNHVTTTYYLLLKKHLVQTAQQFDTVARQTNLTNTSMITDNPVRKTNQSIIYDNIVSRQNKSITVHNGGTGGSSSNENQLTTKEIPIEEMNPQVNKVVYAQKYQRTIFPQQIKFSINQQQLPQILAQPNLRVPRGSIETQINYSVNERKQIINRPNNYFNDANATQPTSPQHEKYSYALNTTNDHIRIDRQSEIQNNSTQSPQNNMNQTKYGKILNQFKNKNPIQLQGQAYSNPFTSEQNRSIANGQNVISNQVKQMLVTNYLPNKGVIPRTTKFIQLNEKPQISKRNRGITFQQQNHKNQTNIQIDTTQNRGRSNDQGAYAIIHDRENNFNQTVYNKQSPNLSFDVHSSYQSNRQPSVKK